MVHHLVIGIIFLFWGAADVLRVQLPGILGKRLESASAEERRLGLSIKQIKGEDDDRRKPKEFHAGPQEAGQSLGDLLKQKFEESENA